MVRLSVVPDHHHCAVVTRQQIPQGGIRNANVPPDTVQSAEGAQGVVRLRGGVGSWVEVVVVQRMVRDAARDAAGDMAQDTVRDTVWIPLYVTSDVTGGGGGLGGVGYDADGDGTSSARLRGSER